MGMKIDEARQQNGIRELLHHLTFQPRAHSNDAMSIQRYRARSVQSRARANHPPRANDPVVPAHA